MEVASLRHSDPIVCRRASHGWDAEMVYYAVSTVTPDNIALLLRHPQSHPNFPRAQDATTPPSPCAHVIQEDNREDHLPFPSGTRRVGQSLKLIPGSVLPVCGVLLHLNVDSNDTLDTAHRVIAYVLEAAATGVRSSPSGVGVTSSTTVSQAHGIQSAWLAYCDVSSAVM